MLAQQAEFRVVAKDLAEKLGRQRMNVLQLSEVLNSVSAVCRRARMDRTSFYD